MRKIFLCFALLVLFITGCKRKPECNGVNKNQYTGYGIIFYHLPISGSSYELIIIPMCGDTTGLGLRNGIQNNLHKLKMLKGISVTIGSNKDSSFKTIFEAPQKLKLINEPTLAAEYQTIYACPVYIEFSGANNVTQSVIGGSKDNIHDTLKFENGQQVILDYFLTDALKVIMIEKI